MAIKREDIFTFKYFEYGQRFHGSYRGMRYSIAREPLLNVFFKSEEEKKDGTIKACAWPEPFSIDKTPEENIICAEFSFDEEGVCGAVDWINSVWEDKYARA